MLPAADLSTGEQTADYRSLVADLVETTLRASGVAVIPPELLSPVVESRLASPRQAIHGPTAVELARSVGADVVVTGFYRLQGAGRIVVGLKCYDVQGQRILAAVMTQGRAGLGLHNTIQVAVDQLIPSIRNQPSLSAPGSGELVDVALYSPDEGAAVFLSPERPAGIVTNGAVALRVAPGGRLDAEVTKPGYHPVRVTIVPEENRSAEVPALIRRTRWSVAGLVTPGSAPAYGVGGRFYPEPDRIFVGLEEAFVVDSEPDDGSKRAYRNDVRVMAGAYLFSGPRSRLRLSYSLGGGLELSNLVEGEALRDLYVNPANIALELNTGRWAWFLRAEMKYSLILEGSRWGRTWQTADDGGLPGTVGVLRKLP